MRRADAFTTNDPMYKGMTQEIDIGKLFEDGLAIDSALEAAYVSALLEARRLGRPIVVWKDGHVLEVPPDEISTTQFEL